MQPSIHSIMHSPYRSTHLPTLSSIHPSIHSFVRLFIHTFIRWFICTTIHSFVHSFVHLFSMHLFVVRSLQEWNACEGCSRKLSIAMETLTQVSCLPPTNVWSGAPSGKCLLLFFSLSSVACAFGCYRYLTQKRTQSYHRKSDQSPISPAASPEILHHTVWRTWLFIAYSDERWL